MYPVATALPNFSKYFCLRVSISSSVFVFSLSAVDSSDSTFAFTSVSAGFWISSSSSFLSSSSITTFSSHSSFVNPKNSLILSISFFNWKYFLYSVAYTIPLSSNSFLYFSLSNTLLSIPYFHASMRASLLYLNRFVYSSAFLLSQLARYVSF